MVLLRGPLAFGFAGTLVGAWSPYIELQTPETDGVTGWVKVTILEIERHGRDDTIISEAAFWGVVP